MLDVYYASANYSHCCLTCYYLRAPRFSISGSQRRAVLLRLSQDFKHYINDICNMALISQSRAQLIIVAVIDLQWKWPSLAWQDFNQKKRQDCQF